MTVIACSVSFFSRTLLLQSEFRSLSPWSSRLPRPSLFHTPSALTMLPDPKDDAHGWASFSDRARMASRKIPAASTRHDCFVGEAFFFGSFLLTLIKRNELAHSAKALFLLVCASTALSGRKRRRCMAADGKDQMLSRYRASSFLLLAQKKRTKENGLPRRSKPIDSLLRGFFDSPSWLGRKTACIHARRPMGLAATVIASLLSEATTKAKAKDRATLPTLTLCFAKKWRQPA